MRITKVYYERLVSHGNYDNTRIGMEADVESPDAPTGAAETFAALKGRVDDKLSEIIGGEQEQQTAAFESQQITNLRQEREGLEATLEKMNEWIRANGEFIRIYQSIANVRVNEYVPF